MFIIMFPLSTFLFWGYTWYNPYINHYTNLFWGYTHNPFSDTPWQ